MQLFLFLLLLFTPGLGSKVSSRVELLLSSLPSSSSSRARNVHESYNLWLYFIDKGPYNTVGPPLNPRTEQRRKKIEEINNWDEEDAPVYPLYIQQVENMGAKLRRTSKWLNAISVSVAPTSIKEVVSQLAELPFVSRVDVVERFTRDFSDPIESETSDININGKRETYALNYGPSFQQLDLIRVPELHDQGYNGSGVRIAVLDSGFMKDHPCILPLNIIGEWDFLENDNNTQSNPPDFQNSHGTAVLSNLGGWDPGNLIGASFGASFLLARTENVSSETQVEEDNFIAAIEWAESLGTDIISASLGYNQWYTYYQKDGATIPVSIAVDKAVKRGVVVVISAGNNGANGISAPADAFDVISVGSVAQDMTLNTWSSIGPSADGRTKPEVVARGSKNWAANAYTIPNNPKGTGFYAESSGTSFSCPIVAGVAALLLQAHPDWTPRMVKEALLMTSSNVAQPDTQMGWGLVHASNAMTYIPQQGDCSTLGCSDLGCCGNATCGCSPERFGPFCNFIRMPCSEFCEQLSFHSGVCAVQPSGFSFRCAAPNAPAFENITAPQCEGCPLDYCGACFGQNTTCDIRCPQGTPHCSQTLNTISTSTTSNSLRRGPDVRLNLGLGTLLVLFFALAYRL